MRTTGKTMTRMQRAVVQVIMSGEEQETTKLKEADEINENFC